MGILDDIEDAIMELIDPVVEFAEEVVEFIPKEQKYQKSRKGSS